MQGRSNIPFHPQRAKNIYEEEVLGWHLLDEMLGYLKVCCDAGISVLVDAGLTV
jgi:hypothetical protein